MTADTDTLRTIENLQPGDHLCCLYQTEDEHRQVVTAYLRRGLEQHQKVLYIVDAHTAETILGYLREEGLDPEPYLARGQLTILTRHDAYMKEGTFDPDAMISLLQAETAQALEEGYAALRVTGEMSWALRGLPGSERLVEYEAKLNHFLPGSQCLAICQYDRRRFAPEILLDVLRTHPLAVVGTRVYENFFYVPPADFLDGNPAEATLERWLSSLAARREAEEALRKSEARMRSIFRAAPIGIGLVSDRVLLDANDRLCEITGYSREELVGKSARILYPSDENYHYVGQEKYRQIEEHGTGSVETRFQCKDGRVIDVLLSSTPLDPADLSAGVTFTVLDITERKQAEEALRESEERHRTLFETMAQGAVYQDADGRIISANPAAQRILGLSLDQMLGRTSTDPRWHAIHEDGSPFPGETHPSMVALRTGEEVRNVVMGVFHPQADEYRWINIHAVPQFRPGEDRPYQVYTTFDDITERVRAEEALRQEKDRAQRYLDLAGVMFIALNHKGEVTLANQKACEVLGYEQEEIIGKNWFECFLPEDAREEVHSILERLMLGEMELAEFHENPVLTREGEERTIAWHNTVLKDDGGHIIGVLGSGEDITERVQGEEALRASEARYRTLFDRVPVGLYRTTPTGQILDANPALVQMLGYQDRQALLAVKVDDMYVDPSERQRFMARLAREGVVRDFEMRLRRKDGQVIRVRDTARAVWDDEGQVLYYEGSMKDVTEQRRLEEQFRQAQKMEAIGRLAGGVAHDFNNILTGVIGYCHLLLASLPSESPQHKDAEEIRKAADRAAALTKQLLAFSRRQIMEPRILNLNDVVANTEKMLQRLIGEDVELVTVLEPTLGAVRADPTHMEQVLMNMAVNAREAMPEGGKLTIETASVVLDQDYAQQHVDVEPGPYVMLAVSDTGAGMDEETRQHIFEPFFTTKAEGTGLGLATVYGIVKQSEGHIWVYSEPGEGTTFKVYLPQVEEPAEPLPQAAAPPLTLPRGTETVLLAEDDDLVRQFARQALEKAGYTVLEARDGEEALALAQAHEGPIHLLLTDVVMPQMNGRQVWEQLTPSRPEMRVLYMSGYTTNAIVHRGVLDSGIPFLHKPFTPHHLATRVREVLDG